MGLQFDKWSIEDVQDTLNHFQCYKNFKITGASVSANMLTQWPEFYDIMDFMSRKKATEELVATHAKLQAQYDAEQERSPR